MNLIKIKIENLPGADVSSSVFRSLLVDEFVTGTFVEGWRVGSTWIVGDFVVGAALAIVGDFVVGDALGSCVTCFVRFTTWK